MSHFNFINSQVTMNTFPCRDELNNIIYNINFDSILNIIKNKIIIANSNNNNYIRIIPADYSHVSTDTVNGIKKFLREKGYTVTDIEDLNGINQGFKITWN